MTDSKSTMPKDDARSHVRVDCKPLLEAATRDLFRANAFRVLGLTVEATVRKISKHGVKIMQMQELGLGSALLAVAFPLSPPPSHDEIRTTLQRLQDPEKRMVDEFFWFWPEQFGQSQLDPAIQALQAGDTEAAMKIWTLKEANPTSAVVAMHNIAVMWHMTTLECENQSAGGSSGENWRPRLDGYWTDALRRWEHLVRDEILWEKLHERARQIGDPRLTSGFVHRFRQALPEAIGKIHGELALAYAEASETGAASTHARFMRETNRGLLDVEQTAQLVLASASHRLKEQIATAQRAAAKPADGAKAALGLAAQATQAVALFDVICGSNSRFRNDLFDEVADACNKIQLAYDRATGDEQKCIEALQAVLPFTTFGSLRARIQQNIIILTKRLAGKKSRTNPRPSPATGQSDKEAQEQKTARVLTKIFGEKSLAAVIRNLNSMQAGKDLPAQKLATVNQFWLAKLEGALAELSIETDAAWYLSDAMGNLLRTISLQAAKRRRDMPTAMKANQLAFKFAKSPILWNNLKKDQQFFQATPGILNHLRRLVQFGAFDVLVLAGVLLGFVIIINLVRSYEDKNNSALTIVNSPANQWLLGHSYASFALRSVRPMVSAPTNEGSSLRQTGEVQAQPATQVTTTTADSNVLPAINYQVPDIYTNELAQDQQAIAEQSSKITELRREEQYLRSRLNNRPPLDHDVGNASMSVMLKQLQVQRATKKLNEMIANYNSKLEQYGTAK